jgi:hypothetical protein
VSGFTRSITFAILPSPSITNVERSTPQYFSPPKVRAGITDYVRPFHDGRHVDHERRRGRNVGAGADGAGRTLRLQVTQGYIDLAGETFREEEALLEARLFGQKSGQK